MPFELEPAIDILDRTPRVLRDLLLNAEKSWTHSNYGEKTWSPFDIVGHLIHCEKTDWMPRLRIVLEYGDAQPFEPFDRFAQERDSIGKSMDDLLDEFADRRAANLRDLRALNLTAEQFQLRGMHPELGAVTLGELLAAWVVHDLHHIAQCGKAMAFQLRDDVGVFKEYLGILPQV